MAAYVEMFKGWLPAMKEDQLDVYGIDLDQLTEANLQYQIITWATALMVECAELVEELQWKPWKAVSKDSKFPVRNSRQMVAREAVDVLHFLAHLLNAAGVTEDDLNWEMMDKRTINKERQEHGYTYG